MSAPSSPPPDPAERPSLLMCCRGCARCALDCGRALHCPIHGTRWSATPPEPVAPTPKGDPA